MRVNYKPSREMKNKIFIKTGQELPEMVQIDFDPLLLNEAQRAFLAENERYMPASGKFSETPSGPEWDRNAEVDAEGMLTITDWIALASVRAGIKKANTAAYTAAQLAYDEAQEKIKAEREKKRKEMAESEARAKERREAERKAEFGEKLEWARKHGTNRLVRGLFAGATMDDVYARERFAFEWRGWIADWTDSAYFEVEDNPSEAALNSLDEAKKAYPDFANRMSIVQITRYPNLEKIGDDEDEDEETPNIEAVVIRKHPVFKQDIFLFVP